MTQETSKQGELVEVSKKHVEKIWTQTELKEFGYMTWAWQSDDEIKAEFSQVTKHARHPQGSGELAMGLASMVAFSSHQNH